MGWGAFRRAIHAPGETKRDLCLRLGSTPPEYLRGEDHMRSRKLRVERQHKLKRAIAKDKNPYLVDLQYPEGEFWPYGAERRLGVHGWGEVRNGYFVPYNNHDYGRLHLEEEEEEAAERWAEIQIQEQAHMREMHVDDYLDMVREEEDLRRWGRHHRHLGHEREGAHGGGHHLHWNPHHYGHGGGHHF